MKLTLFIPICFFTFCVIAQEKKLVKNNGFGLSTSTFFYEKSYKAFAIPTWEMRNNAHGFSVGPTILVTSEFDASDRKYPKLSGLLGSYIYYPFKSSGKLDFYFHTTLLVQRIVDKWRVNYWNSDYSSYETLGYSNTEIIINPIIGYGISLQFLKKFKISQSIGAGYFFSTIDGDEFDDPHDVDKHYDYRPYGNSGLALEVMLGVKIRLY